MAGWICFKLSSTLSDRHIWDYFYYAQGMILSNEIWNLGLKSVHLLALTKSHKFIFAPVQVIYVLTFVTLAGLLSLFTHK